MEGEVLFCPACKSSFRARGPIGEKTVRCPNCGGDLAVSSDPTETAAAAKKPAQATEEWIGKKIAGCRIEKKLGHGGMAVVYRAKHLRLDIPVALKILDDAHARDKSFVQRFLREARAAARLRHPHVVSVLDVGRRDDVYFIIMELVEGGSVRELIEAEGRVPTERALAIMIDVTKALSVAHKQKLIHRDIKPDNIMLDRDGTPKLADLGLARAEDETKDFTITGSGVVVGTPYYIAPEQIEDSHAADIRADIYSLGATFYHMVCGAVPFEANSAIGVLRRHLDDKPISPSKMNAEVPEPISRLILRMMAKDPVERPQNPDELLEELKAAGERLGLYESVQVGGKSVLLPARANASRGRRKYGWTIVAALLVGVSLVALLALIGRVRARRAEREKTPKEVPEPLISAAQPFRLWVMSRMAAPEESGDEKPPSQLMARMRTWPLAVGVGSLLDELDDVVTLVTAGSMPPGKKDEYEVGRMVTASFAPDATVWLELHPSGEGRGGSHLIRLYWQQGETFEQIGEVSAPGRDARPYEIVDSCAALILDRLPEGREDSERELPRAGDLLKGSGAVVFSRCLYHEGINHWTLIIEEYDRLTKEGAYSADVATLAAVAAVVSEKPELAEKILMQTKDRPAEGQLLEAGTLLRQFVKSFVRGDGKAAKERAEEYLAENPYSPRGHLLLGLVRETLLDQTDDALASYGRAQSLNPFYLPAYDAAIRIYAAQKRKDALRDLVDAAQFRFQKLEPDLVQRIRYMAFTRGGNVRRPLPRRRGRRE